MLVNAIMGGEISGAPTLEIEIEVIDSRYPTINHSPWFGITILVSVGWLYGIEPCVVTFSTDHDG